MVKGAAGVGCRKCRSELRPARLGETRFSRLDTVVMPD